MLALYSISASLSTQGQIRNQRTPQKETAYNMVYLLLCSPLYSEILVPQDQAASIALNTNVCFSSPGRWLSTLGYCSLFDHHDWYGKLVNACSWRGLGRNCNTHRVHLSAFLFSGTLLTQSLICLSASVLSDLP